MKFGIIGTGWITHAFLDGAYKNGGELVAIYSRSEQKGLEFGQKYQVTKTSFKKSVKPNLLIYNANF